MLDEAVNELLGCEDEEEIHLIGSIMPFVRNDLTVLIRRKFVFLFPSFFNINLLYVFKIIEIAKNWNDTCVRGLEISH